AGIAMLLPELSAESYFAWTSVGADGAQNASSVFAPMTGATRLIVGFAWPAFILLAWLRNKGGALRLDRKDAVSLSLLFLAALYAFNIYIKGYVSILDSAVLALLFVVFVWMNGRRSARKKRLTKENLALAFETESDARRVMSLVLFGYAAIATLIVSGRFAASLTSIGGSLGSEQFVLAQFAMPLASKGAWLALVGALIWNARSGHAVRMLLMAQAGLWTLLIAVLPVISLFHGAMLGQTDVLMLDARQKSELLLAASQTVFALALLSSMAVSWRSAVVMLGLSVAQGAFAALQPEADSTAVQGIFSAIYLIIAALVVTRNQARVHVLSGLINVNIPSGLRRPPEAESVRQRRRRVGQPQLARAESQIAGRLQAHPDIT
ncbi:MAG: hypothetical protein ACRDIB_19345, partial [Ardenticatenaceae bacterium]